MKFLNILSVWIVSFQFLYYPPKPFAMYYPGLVVKALKMVFSFTLWVRSWTPLRCVVDWKL